MRQHKDLVPYVVSMLSLILFIWYNSIVTTRLLYARTVKAHESIHFELRAVILLSSTELNVNYEV